MADMRIPEFRLERYFACHEFTAKHMLCASDCQTLTVGEVMALDESPQSRLSDLPLGYTEATGSAGLRAEIARIYTSITPDQILTFAGAQEAIFLFMQACLQPGDHIVVHWPCYQSLCDVAESMGVVVSRWSADADRNWQLDLDQLRSQLTPATRLIVLNTPHNPTGFLMSHDDYAELHQLAVDRGFMLLCDEVYRESEYDVAQRLPAACDLGEHAVSIGVMSKTYGLAGLRIGWIVTKNQALFQRIQVLKDYTSMCNSGPSEWLAEVALRNRQQIIDRNLRLIQSNLDLLDAFFSERTDLFQWKRPRAGSIAFPKYLQGDVDAFCHRVLSESGVLLAPGSLFQDNENHFRIGFGRRDFSDGLAALAACLDSQS